MLVNKATEWQKIWVKIVLLLSVMVIENLFNCWELLRGQSAAKPQKRNVQRLFRKEVGASAPKWETPTQSG